MNKKKSLKTVISFILTLTLAFSLSFTAFAAEQNDLGNYTYEHPRANTIEYCIEPGETLNFSDDNGIMPLVNNQFTTTIIGNYSTTTPEASIPDRYMAYEIYATDLNGNTVNGNYRVDLCCVGTIASMSYAIDGTWHKKDWIDLQATNNTCYFRITNNSSTRIRVLTKYYSWR